MRKLRKISFLTNKLKSVFKKLSTVESRFPKILRFENRRGN